MDEKEFIKMQVSQFSKPWMRYFLKYDPVNSLKRIKCPVHLFQTCKTGAMEEYPTIEQTIEPIVLEEISGWVLKQTK